MKIFNELDLSLYVPTLWSIKSLCDSRDKMRPIQRHCKVPMSIDYWMVSAYRYKPFSLSIESVFTPLIYSLGTKSEIKNIFYCSYCKITAAERINCTGTMYYVTRDIQSDTRYRFNWSIRLSSSVVLIRPCAGILIYINKRAVTCRVSILRHF